MSYQLFDPTEALKHMQPRHQEVFNMRCKGGMTFREIAYTPSTFPIYPKYGARQRPRFPITRQHANQIFLRALQSFLYWRRKIESDEAAEAARTFKLRNGRVK